MELLVGCGAKRDKQVRLDFETNEWTELVTLDINDAHDPDVVHDLTQRPLPFEDSTFDEIHAYEVIEHLGRQGDYLTWFAEWTEWWRIMKPDGRFYGKSPHHSSRWAWGDPGHTRVMGPEVLTYLEQPAYEQVGRTAMTDYRFCYQADFQRLVVAEEDGQFAWILQAIKPSRCTQLPRTP
jgi:SAM-dependent methyltransferase